jgi:hypothetical protein
VVTICCALFTSRSGKADGVRLMLAMRANKFLGRHFNSQIDYIVAVIFQNNLDEIFPDIVHVALHRGENDFGALFGVAFFHELLKMAHGGLHRFGRLQHFGDNQLVVVEQASRLRPSQPSADRSRYRADRSAFFPLAIQIGNRPSFEPSRM